MLYKMNYDIKKFNSAVRYYQKKLKNKGKSFFILFHIDNKDAYYSLAPLSRAIHNLKKDVYVMGYYKNSKGFDILVDIWDVYKKKKRMDEKTAALMKFIVNVDKKAKGKFKKVFEKPVIIKADNTQFKSHKFILDYKTNWLVKKEMWNKLLETADTIWTQVFNIKKSEVVGVGFELIPQAKDLDKPLNDYLSSFVIADAMAEVVKNRCKNIRMNTSTSRFSINDNPENVSELLATLAGCEYDKKINEPPFKLFKKVSKLFGTSVLKPADANFGIYGKGTHGKHFFGDLIGYPTLNKKSRWSSPAGMFYKFSWAPQSKYETRGPQSRIGFTSTVPIKAFVETCNINWFEMHRKNQKITDILNKCEKVVVSGKKTNFVVGLVGKKRRLAMNSDIDVRNKIDNDYYKKTKIKTGTMANLPGGESFITPEWVEGILYGDVVISIDDSHSLSAKEPLVVEFKKDKYEIKSGPKKVIAKIKEKKKESWDKLIEQEKNKSLPQEIIDMKKDNFERIGEFAINTNPNAKLSDYLIINEKIADMMHVALGSGFEEDRSSVYHYDIVFNSKQQKLDVCGVSKKKKFWIIKKGKMVV